MAYDRDVWVEIDKAKLINNYSEIRRLADKVDENIKVCTVLKGNAEGMGALNVAKVLEEQPRPPYMYAVATVGEALELRTFIKEKDILTLGYCSEDGYDTAIENDITLPMYMGDAMRKLDEHAAKMGKKALVHIAVNSGMNRIGFAVNEETADMVAELWKLPNLDIRGIFTHIATADEPDKSRARKQKDTFEKFLEMLTARGVTLPIVHAANSPSTFEFPEVYYDMIRPGVSLTGNCDINPEYNWGDAHLMNCYKLKAKLGNVLDIHPGDGVSYNFTFIADRDMTIGLLPLGHADGFTKMFENGNFFVTIRGHRCPLIGTMCMDHCLIDLTNVPDPQVGEEIVIYGDGSTTGPYDGGDGTGDGAMSVSEVAEKRGASNVDEVMCNINSKRVPRRMV